MRPGCCSKLKAAVPPALELDSVDPETTGFRSYYTELPHSQLCAEYPASMSLVWKQQLPAAVHAPSMIGLRKILELKTKEEMH